ncbi:MAG: hypothetical protein N2C14_05665, partial [Planctomycetales bacterium]
LPDDKTLDSVESPRNNNWFLIIIAAKRGITFLEQQPEVNGGKIGAFGHSMGGKLTVMLAGADKRIKAGAPSCGGCGSAPDSVRQRPGAGVRRKQSALYHRTIDDAQYIKEIKVPMLYVGPHNDFNGILDNVYANWKSIPRDRKSYSVTRHMNHRAIPEHLITNILWFDDHLKDDFEFPKTPQFAMRLKSEDGVPQVAFMPDRPEEVAKVDIYYSVDSHILTRFWRTAETARKGDYWMAKTPVVSADQPLFIMANVYYPLKHKVVGYRWSKTPETFGISSEMASVSPAELKQAGVRKHPERSRMVQEKFDDYQDWYQLSWANPNWWCAYTRKIKDPKYAGPDRAKLSLDVKVDRDATLFVDLQDNNWGAFPNQPRGQYYATLNLKGSEDWQTVAVSVGDFKPADDSTKHPLRNWRRVTELGLRGLMVVTQDGKRIELPRKGDGPRRGWPEPRAFRNLRWVGGTYPAGEKPLDPNAKMSDEARGKQFQQGIDDSLELEQRDKNKR